MEDFLIYNEDDVCQDDVKIMEQIINSVSKYLNDDEIRKIQKAYIYAAQAHSWQKRLSGEDYIVHPLRATQILLTLKPDAVTIQACILHDVIEDTDITYDDICKDFGKEVADLCEWLVKVSKVRYQWEDRQIETLKKTFLAMASDLRVIFIKIADRIHNIQTLHFHPKEEKKQRIALETLKIYVPICKKLWLYQFQLYLENGVFKVLHPNEYAQVLNFLKKKYTHANRDIIKGKIKIEKLLSKTDITHFSVTWRVKSPYRIYEKLIKKYHYLDFSKVLDVMAFRIVVDTVPECYNVLWIIHSAYNPLINKIKDYIAVPKFNDYQSLHTTILGLYPFPTEIQIRTKNMHSIAEFGVAAHFLYKDGEPVDNVLTHRQSEWLMNLQNSVQKYQTHEKKDDFHENLSIELLDNNIFIYTPKWDVIELSKWSTVLDFAFRIHTDVWLRFNNATVNGVIKPIGYALKSGDVVAVNTFKNKYTATKYRIDDLHTPTAKAKLIRFIKYQEKEVYIQKWILLLDSKLLKYELPVLSSDKDKIKKHYGEQFEHTLMQIASKAISPMTILKQVYSITGEKPLFPTEAKKNENLWPENKVVIDDSHLLSYDLCPLCIPTPWDKIIARSWKDGIKIHTMHCKGLQTISLDRLIKARRENKTEDMYHFDIELTIENKNINLIALLSILQELGITIDSVKIDKPSETIYIVYISFSHYNPSKIWYVINYIHKHYSDIISIKKKIT
jgi:GTP diphosphokinase / guanosine-3',5'-bis(diphosphate) 3'-diphosphatase